MSARRVAVFMKGDIPRPGWVPVQCGEGYVAYVTGRVLPAGTKLIDGLDGAALFPEDKFPGTALMNSHYVRKARTQPKGGGLQIDVYIAASMGCVREVRVAVHQRPDTAKVVTRQFLVDYDNYTHGSAEGEFPDEAAFERSVLGGQTWEQIKHFTREVRE